MSDVTIKLNVAPPQLAEWIVGGGCVALFVGIFAALIVGVVFDLCFEEEFVVPMIVAFLVTCALCAASAVALYGSAWARYRALVGK